MRALLIAAALLMCSMVVFADDKGKRAKAAFAFQQQKSLDVKADRAKELFSAQASDVSPMKCDCHNTSVCKCIPGLCACCELDLPSYAVQTQKALKDGHVLVAYFGTGGKGVCFDGAISAAGESLPGHPPQTILVGYPHAGQLLISEELPAKATRAEIESAVLKAKAKMEGHPASVPPPAPTVSVPPAPAQTWFVVGPSPAVTVCRT